MKNILITGGLGFIGSNIAHYLEKKNLISLYLIDNFGGYINSTSKNFVDYRKFRIDRIKIKLLKDVILQISK